MTNQNILFFPDYSKANPYQKLLYGAVKAELGITATGFREEACFNKKVLKANCKECGYIHLHWLNLFFDLKHSLVFYEFIENIIYAKKLGYKIIWTVHNLVSHGSANAEQELSYYKLFSKFVDVFLVHSNLAKSEVVNLYEADSGRVFVVQHGSYQGFYKNSISKAVARQQLNIADDEFVFIYFGLIRGYKGVERLAQNFNELSKTQSKIKLLIVGKPKDSQVVDYIKSLKNNNIILVSQFVADDAIQNYFNAADIAVLPFEQILTSGSTILALSFNKPVIVPKKGVLPELIDEQTGFLFDQPNELQSIMQGCLQLWQSGLFSNKFAPQNFEPVLNKLNWHRIAVEEIAPALASIANTLPVLPQNINEINLQIKKEKFLPRRICVYAVLTFKDFTDRLFSKLGLRH